MPRPATGCAFWDPRTEKWIAIVTLNDGERKRVEMSIDQHDKPAAKARAKEISDLLRTGRAIDGGIPETVSQYFDRWVKDRERRGIGSTRNDRSRFTVWINPRIGTLDIRNVQKVDLERFVEFLDKSVREKKLSWKTAINVWNVAQKMFDDCARSKTLALRAREDNPAKEVRGPDRGDDRTGPYLYPSELDQLLACEEVPMERRTLYAFGVFTGMRAGEIRALRWANVDLEKGFITVAEALDYDTDKLKAPKTGAKGKGRVAIESALMPLLRRMKKEAKDTKTARVFEKTPHKSEWPDYLRRDLKTAKVTRAELFADTQTERAIVFHDLRHTYGTWRAIRGDSLPKIKGALRHTQVATTQRYINEAESFEGAGFGVPFAPFPVSFAKSFQRTKLGAKSSEVQRPQGDSNPR